VNGYILLYFDSCIVNLEFCAAINIRLFIIYLFNKRPLHLFILHYNLLYLACISMNMKVHQTLVWLNLLSLGTRDFPHQQLVYSQLQITTPSTMLRHFVCMTPAFPLSSCKCNWALSCSIRAAPPPLPTWPSVARCYFTATFAKNHAHFPIF